MVDVTTFLSSCVRSVIIAPKGKKLVVVDYASVESRIVAWLSNCSRMQDLFRNGKDSYKDFASELFGVPYEEVTDEQRKYSKAPTLGCAYALGRYGLIEYAKGMGTEMTEDQAEHAVRTFRGMYWEIPQMWDWLVDAQKDVISNYTVHQGYAVKIWRDNNFLFITLPSGRSIAYYKPLVEMKVPPWGGRPRSTITYMGRAKVGRAWVRLTTHGGKTTENECQGIGRDKLGDDMLHVASRTNWDVVLHVHDEPVLEVPEDQAEEALAYTIKLMSKSPTWAPGLLMGAAGFITDRYTKD